MRLLILLLIFSCAEPTVNVLSQRESDLKTRGGYESYLALEYLEFARKLSAAKDEKTAEYFSRKGLAITKGEEIIPENPIKWKADLAQMEEMILMQKRLEKILSDHQLKFHLPIQTAHLTYLYDCWISRESKEIFRSDELAQCRVRFSKLLDEIEQFSDSRTKDKQAKVEITEPKFEHFDIFFDFNNSKFSDKANKDLLALLSHLSKLYGDYRILLVGNADRVGNELYNQQLAYKRSEVVKNYLIKNGVTSDMIETRVMGEDFPDILTKDGSQKQNNRTVGIYVLQGAKSFDKFPLPLIENFVYRESLLEERKKRGLK
ncbi:MAG: OmpA family protein [Proteobacteria bacterium]|nr:OmpA family protein [Pseudomonadota bacterium]